MINVVDLAQKISYTRKELTSMGDFQINIQQSGLNFFGHPRKNGYIPGYLFKVPSQPEFTKLKHVLTRCLFEA